LLFLFLKGMAGALAPFRYLVNNVPFPPKNSTHAPFHFLQNVIWEIDLWPSMKAPFELTSSGSKLTPREAVPHFGLLRLFCFKLLIMAKPF
jgi:hypothetical protein